MSQLLVMTPKRITTLSTLISNSTLVLYDKLVESLTINSAQVAPMSRAWLLLTNSIFDMAHDRLVDTRSTWTGLAVDTTVLACLLLQVALPAGT